MPWEFDHDNYDPDTLEGFDRVAPGKYHLEISHVDEEGGRNDEMVVDCEVLAGSTPDQEGKTHREYFSRSAKAEKRALLLALACRLTSTEELKAAKEERRNPIIQFDRAVGRQFCAELHEEEYEDKNGNKKKKTAMGFAMFAVNSPKAAGFPINKGMLGRATSETDDPFGGGEDAPAVAEAATAETGGDELPETTLPEITDPFGDEIPL